MSGWITRLTTPTSDEQAGKAGLKSSRGKVVFGKDSLTLLRTTYYIRYAVPKCYFGYVMHSTISSSMCNGSESEIEAKGRFWLSRSLVHFTRKCNA
jgi:hypothetical protein